jgi:hypothetical protein
MRYISQKKKMEKFLSDCRIQCGGGIQADYNLKLCKYMNLSYTIRKYIKNQGKEQEDSSGKILNEKKLDESGCQINPVLGLFALGVIFGIVLSQLLRSDTQDNDD